MSTVVVRNNGRQANRSTRRRRRQVRRVQPVTVVTPARQPRRRRGRRGRGRNNRRNRGGTRASNQGQRIVFAKDNIQGNSSGCIKFGPDLSEHPPFSNGELKSCHQYKIVGLEVHFVSEASSTSSGSIAYELDPDCELSQLSSTLNKFPITKGGKEYFGPSKINGLNWHKVSTNQFHFLYKGNGSSTIAGSFHFTMYTRRNILK